MSIPPCFNFGDIYYAAVTLEGYKKLKFRHGTYCIRRRGGIYWRKVSTLLENSQIFNDLFDFANLYAAIIT